ncbi:MAG: hypothetical protein ACREQZ_03500 [Woeseiaceae bacterium]
MNPVDIVVIVLCAVIGWTIVSVIFRKKETGGLREFCRRELSDEEIRASWAELLQVGGNVSADDLDAAYVMRVKALRNTFPAVLTDAEGALFQRGERLLGRARDLAKDLVTA